MQKSLVGRRERATVPTPPLLLSPPPHVSPVSVSRGLLALAPPCTPCVCVTCVRATHSTSLGVFTRKQGWRGCAGQPRAHPSPIYRARKSKRQRPGRGPHTSVSVRRPMKPVPMATPLHLVTSPGGSWTPPLVTPGVPHPKARSPSQASAPRALLVAQPCLDASGPASTTRAPRQAPGCLARERRLRQGAARGLRAVSPWGSLDSGLRTAGLGGRQAGAGQRAERSRAGPSNGDHEDLISAHFVPE